MFAPRQIFVVAVGLIALQQASVVFGGLLRKGKPSGVYKYSPKTSTVPQAPPGAYVPYFTPYKTEAPQAPDVSEPELDECADKVDSNYPIGECLNIYYSCVGQTKVPRQCQSNLVFDPEFDDCTAQAKSRGCTGQERPPDFVPPETTPTPIETGFDCSNKQDGFYGSAACSSTYFSCVGGVARRLQCKPPLYFDDDLQICDAYAEIQGCTGKERTSPKPLEPEAPQPQAEPVNFDCTNLADGNYPNPEHKCSSIYYSCIGEQAKLMECGANLIYDAGSDACELSQYVVSCGGSTRPPAAAPEPSQYVTVVPPEEFDCSELDDGFYGDKTKPCSQKFYSCSGGQAERMHCPKHLAFDNDSQQCQPKADVYACSGIRPQPSGPPLPPTLGPTFAPVNFDCKSLPDGPYAAPSQPCSMWFYQCSNGQATEEVCPPVDGGLDTYFDDETKQCETFENVEACSGLPKPEPTATTPEQDAPNLSTDFDCSKSTNGLYADYQNQCSQSYYVCAAGLAYKQSCADDSYFDVDNQACSSRQFIPQCGGQRPTTYVPEPNDQQTLAPPRPKLFDCSKKPDGSYPNPNKQCSNFYFICSNKMDDIQYCAANLYYDPTSKVCKRYVDVQICSGHAPLTPPPTLPNAPPVFVTFAPVQFDCNGKKDGDYGSEQEQCSSIYYSCVAGVALKRQCSAKSLAFDDESDQCLPKSQIAACKKAPVSGGYDQSYYGRTKATGWRYGQPTTESSNYGQPSETQSPEPQNPPAPFNPYQPSAPQPSETPSGGYGRYGPYSRTTSQSTYLSDEEIEQPANPPAFSTYQPQTPSPQNSPNFNRRHRPHRPHSIRNGRRHKPHVITTTQSANIGSNRPSPSAPPAPGNGYAPQTPPPEAPPASAYVYARQTPTPSAPPAPGNGYAPQTPPPEAPPAPGNVYAPQTTPPEAPPAPAYVYARQTPTPSAPPAPGNGYVPQTPPPEAPPAPGNGYVRKTRPPHPPSKVYRPSPSAPPAPGNVYVRRTTPPSAPPAPGNVYVPQTPPPEAPQPPSSIYRPSPSAPPAPGINKYGYADEIDEFNDPDE